jgi:UDP-glucuronate 4-epimerase
VEKCVGKKANIHIMPEQPGDVERTCADISKAKRLLGYDPKVRTEKKHDEEMRNEEMY